VGHARDSRQGAGSSTERRRRRPSLRPVLSLATARTRSTSPPTTTTSGTVPMWVWTRNVAAATAPTSHPRRRSSTPAASRRNSSAGSTTARGFHGERKALRPKACCSTKTATAAANARPAPAECREADRSRAAHTTIRTAHSPCEALRRRPVPARRLPAGGRGQPADRATPAPGGSSRSVSTPQDFDGPHRPLGCRAPPGLGPQPKSVPDRPAGGLLEPRPAPRPAGTRPRSPAPAAGDR
jgi:hypothetical protein